MSLVLIVVFFILLTMGVPVFLTMGIASLAAFVHNGRIALTQVPQQVFFGINSFPIMAIPLFILAADIMTDGKLTDILITFCDKTLGHVRGGLGHVNVVLSMIFSAISGSAVADAAGPGKIIMSMMRKAGYDPYYSGALTASSAVMGVMIPPSIPIIIYALSEGRTSLLGMFAAGYIPGILVAFALIIFNAVESKRKNYVFNTVRPSILERLKSTWKALPALLMPVMIIVCVLGGITTPTEASALAVAYALFVGFFITRKLSIKRLPKVFLGSAVISSAILMIVAMGSLFAWVLTFARIPQTVALWAGTLTTDPILTLFMIAILALITGLCIDTIPATMILAPIVSAIGAAAGINPFQVALVMIMSIGISMITPPVAPLLFVVSTVGKLRLEKLIIKTLPCFLVQIGVLILIILIPPLTTWLPSLLFRR